MSDTLVSAEAPAPSTPSTPTTALIHARGLTKKFGDFTAVDGIDFDVAPGESFGFLGPNGAGKTSTMRMIGCVSPISDGTLTVLGQDPTTQGPRIRSRIGVVPQQDSLDTELTVRENIIVYGRYFGLTHSEVESRLPRLLEFATLESRAHSRIQELSGGMKRRLVLARALVNDPDLIFLDEPTTGLDPQARHQMWERLRLLLRQGKTILLTTHFMDEAERLATRLAVIDHGVMIASDTPRALLAKHVEPEVVEVYGDEAKAWADVHGRRLSQRLEISGETAFAYASDPQPMLADLATRSGVRYLHRPANLEDLFIKLTGRELRD